MKEATGELNMTVITIVAIAAIAAFFYALVWPSIKVSIAKNQCAASCGDDNFNEDAFTTAALKAIEKEDGTSADLCDCDD